MITVVEELSGHHPTVPPLKHLKQSGTSGNAARFGGNITPHSRPAEVNGLLEDAFEGDHAPYNLVLHEKPWHRLAIEYTIQGLDQIEVANLLQRSVPQVRDILRQPWARERIIQRAKMSTMDKVKEWLENECLPNLEVIKAVRDNPEARAADRKGAAEYLTDRFLGKAVQPVSESSVPATELTKDEIERRLAKLAEGVEAT